MIFSNATAAAVWKESWCDRCFDPDQVELREHGNGRGCGVLLWALSSRTVPKEMVKNGRDGALMKDAFRCSEFKAKPPPRPRLVVVEQEEVLF